MSSTHIVLGSGFGDEGKGLTTSYLASEKNNPLVIRFNGGHQAGHTVEVNGYKHVFSCFGSATLQGVSTFWSRFCTFCPTTFVNEYADLVNHNIKPRIYIDPTSPICTPYDKLANMIGAKVTNHGSVGVGFGTTVQRQEDFFKLHMMDLFYPGILETKVHNISQYYMNKGLELPLNIEELMTEFYDSIEAIKELKKLNIVRVKTFNELVEHPYFETYIFEGAQGILLDQDFGFFPNVTRSNTTSKNALTLIKEANLPLPEIYYATRCYHTRHGNGWLPHQDDNFNVNKEGETNVLCEYQGVFRYAPLNIDLLNYAIEADSTLQIGLKRNLVISCLDQIGDNAEVVINDKRESIDKLKIHAALNANFNKVFHSFSPDGTKIKKVYDLSWQMA